MKRENASFSGTEYVLYLFTVIFLGMKHLYKADDVLGDETQLATILGFRRGVFPTARGLYRLLCAVTSWEVKRLGIVNRILMKRQKHLFAKKRWITVDIDQTKKLTEGKTIERAKPCFSKEKKGKLGLRISASVVEGLVFSQKLEPGNVGNADAFEEVFTDTLGSLDTLSSPIRSRRVRLKKVMLRIDGGYFSGKTLNYLETIRAKRRLDFIVRAQSDLVLVREARIRKKPGNWQEVDERTQVLRFTNQQVLSDAGERYTVVIVREKQRRIVSRKKRVMQKMVVIEYPLVTTLASWSNKRIITFYKKRQTIEDVFKDFNQSFHAEKLPSHAFWGNALYFQMVSLVSNVSVFFKGSPLYRKLEACYGGDLAGQMYYTSLGNPYKTTGYRH